MNKKVLFFILTAFIFLLLIINTPIKAGSFEGGLAPKQVQNLAKIMKNKYMKNIKMTANIASLPETDTNYNLNRNYCKNPNNQKSEQIGILKCMPGGMYTSYEKQGRTSKAFLIYGGVAKLLYMVRQIGSGYPIVKYGYRINYPNATFDKAKVLITADNKLAFDKAGKIKAFLYNGQCYKENDKGQIVKLMYAKNLCSDVIELHYYDDYKQKPVPMNF